MAVELDDLKIYPDKKEAKLQIGDQVIENRERLKEAEGKYYSPLGSNLKPLELRSFTKTLIKLENSSLLTLSIFEIGIFLNDVLLAWNNS